MNKLNRGTAVARIALLLALSLVVAACGSDPEGSGTSIAESSSTTGATEGDTPEASDDTFPEVTWAFPGQPLTSVAATVPNYLAGISVAMNVGQTLLQFDSEGNIGPGLASEWEEVSPTEYLYTIDPDARFSDGSPVLPEDVIYSYDLARDPETGSWLQSFFSGIESMEAVGENQVRINLKGPNTDWVFVPAHLVSIIYQKASLVANDSTPIAPKGAPIGSGPYMIEEIAADYVSLVPNPHYGGEAPKAQRVVVRFIADDATRLAAMTNGDIDGTFLVPITSTPDWEQIQGANLLSVPTNTFLALNFNHRREPFSDPHARRAVMYAFNRAGIVEQVFNGNARVAWTMQGPEMWTGAGLTEEEVEAMRGEMGPTYDFDMEKAREELAQSQFPDGFTAEAVFDSTLSEASLGLQVLAQDLTELGIELEVREATDAELSDEEEFDWDITVAPGGVDWPDPLALLRYSCVGRPEGGGSDSGYVNAELKQMLDDASALRPEERVDQVIEALTICMEDLPMPTLWWHNGVVAVNESFDLVDYGPWTMLQTPWMLDIRAVGD